MLKWILPLSLLITFEFLADIFAKQWSLGQKVYLAVLALACYLIANTFWLFALKNGSGLARGAVIFSVASGVIATVIGILLYKETLNRVQFAGILLGFVSITLLFWND